MALLTCGAAAIRFAALGHQSFWVDETVTAKLLAKSLPGLLGALPHSESTPPLYYIVAWVWSRIFGTGEFGLRSLSALVGTITVPAVYAAAAQLVSRRAGLIAAALATVSPILVWYSQEARAYGLFVLLSVLTLFFFARAYRQPSSRSQAGWAVSSALALLTHYFALFLIAGEAALLLYRRRDRAACLAAGSVAAVAAALLPLAAYQARYGSSAWIRSVGLGMRVKETFEQLLVPSTPSIWAGAGVPEGTDWRWLLAVAVLVLAGAAIWLGRSAERQGAFLSLGLGALAVGAPILFSLVSSAILHGKGDVFLFRNVICAWLPLTLVVAAALSTPRMRIFGPVLVVGLVAASAVQLVVNVTTPHLRRDDWRLIARQTGRSNSAIVLSPSWELAALQYYRPDLRTTISGNPIDEIDVVARRWVPSYSLAVTSFSPPEGFRREATRTLQNWTLTVYHSPVARRVTSEEFARVQPPGASRLVLESASR